jgi:plasmid stability protein
MSTIVVKNFPEELLERLKDRAERNHRSMTKEVVHLVAAGLGSEEASQPPAPRRPPPAPVTLRSGRMISIEDFEAAMADRAIESGKTPDGREALRAALIKQPDGTYLNVLGIEDGSFFDTLERIRAEAKAPDVKRLFDDPP